MGEDDVISLCFEGVQEEGDEGGDAGTVDVVGHQSQFHLSLTHHLSSKERERERDRQTISL